jgi:hypothetical protein
MARSVIFLMALICCACLLWLSGGIRWLEKDVFAPRRPSFMPANSVWIEAPSLPLSWHHGWWFGCGVSGMANHCRLVGDGRTIYGGEYLSCRTQAPIPEQSLKLIAPPGGSQEMWLFGEHADAVAGFTEDGDILLPVAFMAKCNAVRARPKANP